MENLKQPVHKVLLNKIDYTDVGAYYDSVAGVNMLSFKKHGVNIPFVSGVFNGAKMCSDNGTAQAIAMELNATCPCTACNWEYNVTIVKKVQLPGVNNIETNYNRKSYNGVIDKVTCTGNKIDDVWLLQAEDDIITQITQDTGQMNSNPDPITGGGAWVNAKREYKFTVSNNTVPATDSITVTNTTTGVATTMVGTGAGTLLTFLAVINAQTATTGVIALGVNNNSAAFNSETEILLQSATPGQLFTLAIAGTTVSVDYRRILFISKTARTQFAVQYAFGNLYNQPVNPQILFKKSQWVIDGSNPGAVANSGISFYVENNLGVTTAYNVSGNNATAALMVTAINNTSTLGQNHGWATLIGTNIYVNGDDSVYGMYMAVSPSPANYVTPGYTAACQYIQLACTFDQWGNVQTGILPQTPHGSFPMNLGVEAFQKTAMMTDSGSVPFQNDEKADPTVDYCTYFMRTLAIKPPASGGASDRLFKESIVEVYIKKSLVATAFLYPGVNAASLANQLSSLNAAPTTTPTVTFEALLQLWAGTGTIVQVGGVVTGGLNPNAWTN